jgi:hypothetical protein
MSQKGDGPLIRSVCVKVASRPFRATKLAPSRACGMPHENCGAAGDSLAGRSGRDHARSRFWIHLSKRKIGPSYQTRRSNSAAFPAAAIVDVVGLISGTGRQPSERTVSVQARSVNARFASCVLLTELFYRQLPTKTRRTRRKFHAKQKNGRRRAAVTDKSRNLEWARPRRRFAGPSISDGFGWRRCDRLDRQTRPVKNRPSLPRNK